MAESAPSPTFMQKLMANKYYVGGVLLLLVVGAVWWKYFRTGCCSTVENKTGMSMDGDSDGNSNNTAPANKEENKENPYTTNSSGELVPKTNSNETTA